MQPNCLNTVELINPALAVTMPDGSVRKKNADDFFNDLGPIARRYGRIAKGTVLPETRQLACPRVKVADLPPKFLPQRFIEALEQNQMIASCCRHPENHEIEAHRSHPEEPAPDIYTFHCTCGRKHTRFCVGFGPRPVWNAS